MSVELINAIAAAVVVVIAAYTAYVVATRKDK